MANYNRRHGVKELNELKSGDFVWIIDLKKYGEIVKCGEYPRSYIVKCGSKYYRRNRGFLIPSKMFENTERSKKNEDQVDIDFVLNQPIQNQELANENNLQQNVEDNLEFNPQQPVSIDVIPIPENEQLVENHNQNNLTDDTITNESLNSRTIDANAEGRPRRDRKKPNWFNFSIY